MKLFTALFALVPIVAMVPAIVTDAVSIVCPACTCTNQFSSHPPTHAVYPCSARSIAFDDRVITEYLLGATKCSSRKVTT
ncbi:hypothetical protein BT96DRAFT_118542 [Gymnopus androsaceus JB14]|uniref:Uncharacterized protein n=1 Tax=Gymnopus androsaceus JB14 TaxID=1447944 RepID=A0A6A4HD13_9AGAR|nr:hypothetical protein BT96DRAFT_118542 [Gymnopus androsaceus JB14]